MPTVEEKKRNRSRLIMPQPRLMEGDQGATPDEPGLDYGRGRQDFFGRRLTPGFQRALIQHPFDAEAWMSVDRQQQNGATALDEAVTAQGGGGAQASVVPRAELAASPAPGPSVPFSPLAQAIETGQVMPPYMPQQAPPTAPPPGLSQGGSAPTMTAGTSAMATGLEPLPAGGEILSPAAWAKKFHPEYTKTRLLERGLQETLWQGYKSYRELEAYKDSQRMGVAQENRLRGQTRLEGAIAMRKGGLPSTIEGAYVQGKLTGASDEELEPFRRMLAARYGGPRDSVEKKAEDEAAAYLAQNSNLNPLQKLAYLKSPGSALPADVQGGPVPEEVEAGLVAKRDPWFSAPRQDVGKWWKAVQAQRTGPPLNLRDQATVAKRIRDTVPQIEDVLQAGSSGELAAEEVLDVLALLYDFDPEGLNQALENGLISEQQRAGLNERLSR